MASNCCKAKGRGSTNDIHRAPAGARRFDSLFVPGEFWGKTPVEDARTAGVPVAEVATDAGKVTRAIPAAARLRPGKVWWPHPGEPGYRRVETERCPELPGVRQGPA